MPYPMTPVPNTATRDWSTPAPSLPERGHPPNGGHPFFARVRTW